MTTLRAAASPALTPPSPIPLAPTPPTPVGPAQAVGQSQADTWRAATWLRLWMTMLGLAFLTGRPLPSPPPQALAAAAYQPRRTGRMIASLAERLAAERGAALRGCYPPAELARSLAGLGKRLLAGQQVPARAGQVWVIPQLRWAHEATRIGWDSVSRDGAGGDGTGRDTAACRPDDLAPPLDFALAGLPDWPGILVGQRLDLLLRHPAALTAPANSALAATALFGADGHAAFRGALAADLALVIPPTVPSRNPFPYRTDIAGSPSTRGSEASAVHLDPAAVAEAARVMDCPADWLIALMR
ncbi:MAG: hypothetical protein J2P25_12835 [Nocardiopsaceae bacterium]|nr:hypothetical protein [Nocardiopsaceae bacterium]